MTGIGDLDIKVQVTPFILWQGLVSLREDSHLRLSGVGNKALKSLLVLQTKSLCDDTETKIMKFTSWTFQEILSY